MVDLKKKDIRQLLQWKCLDSTVVRADGYNISVFHGTKR